MRRQRIGVQRGMRIADGGVHIGPQHRYVGGAVVIADVLID